METSLAQPSPFSVPTDNPDILSQLLENQKSPHTWRAYKKDIRDFFRFVADANEPTPILIEALLKLEQPQALALVLRYKNHLRDVRCLKEATINRRLAALKALVRLANQLGQCRYTLDGIRGEKVIHYRDTTGVSQNIYRQILKMPDQSTTKGKRDYAILRLLWDNALRRNEVVQTNLGDLDLERRSLDILGKGKGNQKEQITLSRATVTALESWLTVRPGPKEKNQPLFVALDRAHQGHRLTGTAIYQLVRSTARAAGVQKVLSPHRIRHAGITAALDATNGDVRKVQKFSRHADLNTLMIYDDNRRDVQGEITDLLAGLI
ncbi:tyrosine recombinase [[Synechococcus] sp. NIES-970]|uniref:tyrosine-type recombinase/integrase n=1 Tax=Picosynechococcus sp. NKBG15041c TaxID=1407650 RepID=UPI000401F3EC|nr:tyrosine-type recombinase/integrase [Picosynechococcus sp. NKBG15041c]BAW96699.1 tyrosine recombinase [[Synechococcus] sp. NIES-970]